MAGLSAALRFDWLTAERARAYARVIVATTSVIAVLRVVTAAFAMGPLGFPIRSDFVSFWAASHLALAGRPGDAYSVALHSAVEQVVLPGTVYSAFLYPPVWLLFCLPLALLPLWWSLAAFLAATGAGAWLVVRRFAPGAGMAFLSYPAVVLNVAYGQNGLLTTALFGGGLLALRRRPWLAGLCFGCLAYKPHLAAVVPIALLAGRQFRALAATAATGAALFAASAALFGVGTWQAFLAQRGFARLVLEHGLATNIGWESSFRAVVQLGGSLGAAYAVQAAVALAVVAAMVLGCRRRPDAITALLPLATLLASPFLLAYDLALVALPMAWLLREGVTHGFRPWEKPLLCTGFLLPVISILASAAGLPVLGPLVMLALMAGVLNRGHVRPAGR